MMPDDGSFSIAGSNVNRIVGVKLDDSGFIHTPYGSYHPVTGEGLPINAPEDLMREILTALIQDGIDSGPAEEFDWKAFVAERFGNEKR